jgi:hypothetical protein
MLELYNVRKALSPCGYAVCGISKRLGGGDAHISAVSCELGEHDDDIEEDIALLLSLPDDVSEEKHAAARRAAFHAKQQKASL